MNREIVGEIPQEKQHVIDCRCKAWGLRGGPFGCNTYLYDEAFFGSGPAFSDRGHRCPRGQAWP